MIAFKEEYRKLVEWLEEQLNESKKLPNDGSGLDAGLRCQQEREIGKEVRRRLRELEAKHGITVDELVCHEKMKLETA